jgi:hypothetical protein
MTDQIYIAGEDIPAGSRAVLLGPDIWRFGPHDLDEWVVGTAVENIRAGFKVRRDADLNLREDDAEAMPGGIP